MIQHIMKSIYWSIPPGKLLRAYWLLPIEAQRVIYRIFLYPDYRKRQRMRTQMTNDYVLKHFDEFKCIFVHIPKTAGFSINSSLFGSLGGGHMTIGHYQLVFSQSEFNSYFKFTFVRNPWDRLVSAYHFLKAGGFNEADKKWAEDNLAEYKDFDSFVNGWLSPERIQSPNSILHFLPQFKFVCLRDNLPMVDFIGHFENLEEDVSYIGKRIGACKQNLLFINKTRARRDDYRSYYTEDTKRIVADVYSTDIRIFGYDFENKSL